MNDHRGSLFAGSIKELGFPKYHVLTRFFTAIYHLAVIKFSDP
jgi:hypothetical protein